MCINRINGDVLDSTYFSDYVSALVEYGSTTWFPDVAF